MWHQPSCAGLLIGRWLQHNIIPPFHKSRQACALQRSEFTLPPWVVPALHAVGGWVIFCWVPQGLRLLPVFHTTRGFWEEAGGAKLQQVGFQGAENITSGFVLSLTTLTAGAVRSTGHRWGRKTALKYLRSGLQVPVLRLEW